MAISDRNISFFSAGETYFNDNATVRCAEEWIVKGTNVTEVQLKCNETGNWDEFPGCVVRGCDPNDINQGM